MCPVNSRAYRCQSSALFKTARDDMSAVCADGDKKKRPALVGQVTDSQRMRRLRTGAAALVISNFLISRKVPNTL